MNMEFTVELYETETGACPVREFLDKLKTTDPDDFAAVVAGLAKLRNRQYHGSRCPRRLVMGFLNCGMSANSILAYSGFL